MSDLTDKQQVWLEHYLTCWNATEAARKAGYKDPYKSGYENSKKLYIREEIAARLAAKKMTADEALARLSDIARGDMTDFLAVQRNGLAVLDMNAAERAGKLFLVKKYKETKYGFEVELHDPMRALELIAKHHGVLRENVAIVFPPEIERLIKRMGWDLNEIQAEFVALLEQEAANVDRDS